MLGATQAFAQPAATQSVEIELAPLREELLDREGPPVIPEAGRLLVVGRFDDPRLGIENINQITVLTAGGRQLPLQIESDSIYFEFDRIVSLRFFFTVDGSETGSLSIQWGPDVRAQNAKVKQLALDPAHRDLYREFRWRPRESAPKEESSVASIEVIADSSAEYHFLWYLLPMAVIFVLLTIRKASGRYPVDQSPR